MERYALKHFCLSIPTVLLMSCKFTSRAKVCKIKWVAN